MKEFRHRCFRSTLTFQPSPLREDRVTVGFVLYEDGPGQRREIRFAPDLSPLRCLAPEIDLEMVEAMLLEFEDDIRKVVGTVTDAAEHLPHFPREIPTQLNISAPIPILSNDFDQEIEIQSGQLFRSLQSSDLEETQKKSREYGQIYLQKQMHTQFAEFGVWDYFDKQISVAKYALKGDRHRIHCGYLDSKTNTYRMFDPVSLVASVERAKILALSWPRIREGLQSEMGRQYEMFAIVEDGINRKDGDAANAWAWMETEGVHVNPVSTLPQLAVQARSALNL